MIPTFDFIECKENYIEIPIYWGVTNYYEIIFKGWENFTLIVEDKRFSEVCSIASHAFTAYIVQYKEKYAFTKPILSWKPHEGCISLKFATLSLHEYNERMKKESEICEDLE